MSAGAHTHRRSLNGGKRSSRLLLIGAPYGNRTRVSAVTGNDLNSSESAALHRMLAWHMLWHMSKVETMTAQRHVRLFRNGRNQAVRIPVEFELPGDEAIMQRDGDRLVIEPVRKRGLLALLKAMQPIDEAFPVIGDPLPRREKPL